MKKIFALLLSAAIGLSFGVLVACTEKKDSSVYESQNESTASSNDDSLDSSSADSGYSEGKTYTISLPVEQVGYTLTADTLQAEEGASITLTFAVLEKYCIADDFSVKMNDVPLAGYNGVYKINNIKSNITITVTGVIPDVKTVTYLSEDGGEVLYTETVEKGENASYDVIPQKSGAKFLGWTDLYGNAAVLTGISKDYTVYASFSDAEVGIFDEKGVTDISHRSWYADGELSILMIGNSFSVDTMEYLYEIAKDADVEKVYLGRLVYGGCSVDQHYGFTLSGEGAYEFSVNSDGKWIVPSWYKEKKFSMSEALAQYDWDFVSLQQASGYSGEASSYTNVQNLIDALKKEVNEDARFVWNMTWAYDQESTHADFPKYDKDQDKMYGAIVEAVQSEIVPLEDIAMVLPTGTAIQNYREKFGDVVTRDGYHLNEFGRYLAGLAFFKALTGAKIGDIVYLPSGYDGLDRSYAIEAAVNATRKFFEVTPSVYTPSKYTVTYMSYDGASVLGNEEVAFSVAAKGCESVENGVTVSYEAYTEPNGTQKADLSYISEDITVYCKANGGYIRFPFTFTAFNGTTVITETEEGIRVNTSGWAQKHLIMPDQVFTNGMTVEFSAKSDAWANMALFNTTRGELSAGKWVDFKFIKNESGIVSYYINGTEITSATIEADNLNQISYTFGGNEAVTVYITPLKVSAVNLEDILPKYEETDPVLPPNVETVILTEPVVKIAQWTTVNNHHDGDWAYVKADAWAAINFGLCDYAFVNGTTVEFEIKNTSQSGVTIAYKNTSPGFYVGTGVTTKIKIVKDETGLITWYQDGVAKNTTTDGAEITNLNQLQFNITEGVAVFVSPLTVAVPVTVEE